MPRGSYARIGANDEAGHAYFTQDWRLECPRFHQYERIGEVAGAELVDCLPRADVVVVSGRGQRWLLPGGLGRASGEITRILQEDFVCSDQDGLMVCIRP